MAERLAPEQAPLRITSRPERPKGRTRRASRRLLGTILALALVVVGTALTLHFLAIQTSAQEERATALIPQELPARVLVVLARPGQEVTMAGTLASLDDAGVEVSILALTSGEAQPPEVDYGLDRIGDIRADELAASAAVLGVESVTIAGYPDGGLLAADPAEITDAIGAAIDEFGPSVVLTVGDLTGDDTDSQAVTTYSLAAARAEGSTVARVWTVTRGDREIDWNARIAEPVGRADVPDPEVAVRIERYAAAKSSVLLAHGTQSPDLVASTYPYADRIPPWAYFRFWDREYFALGWGPEMQ